jgi:hypothetical protein
VKKKPVIHKRLSPSSHSARGPHIECGLWLADGQRSTGYWQETTCPECLKMKPKDKDA